MTTSGPVALTKTGLVLVEAATTTLIAVLYKKGAFSGMIVISEGISLLGDLEPSGTPFGDSCFTVLVAFSILFGGFEILDETFSTGRNDWGAAVLACAENSVAANIEIIVDATNR